MKDHGGHFTRKEAEAFLKADLRNLAEELTLAYELSGDAQVDALDMATKHAEQISIWYSGNENLTAIEQALSALAFQITRREKQTGLSWLDIPMLSEVVDKALGIEPRKSPSRYSEKVGDFRRALGELQESWNWRDDRI